MLKKNKPLKTGFTLIEMTTVVAIVGIASCIALATYSNHVKRSERIAARAVMLEAANWMERRYAMHHSYLSKNDEIPALPDGLNRSPKTGSTKYVISLTKDRTQDTSYQLRATPTRSDKCGILTLDHTGARGLIDNTVDLTECWGR